MGLKIKNLDVILQVGEKQFKQAKDKFEIAVNDEVTRMVLRTRAGKDINNQPFEEYTPKYAAYRSKKGRNTSPVDLQFTGKMLSAITTKSTETKDKITITVFFNSVKESVKAAGNLVKRNFFGFSEEQRKEVGAEAAHNRSVNERDNIRNALLEELREKIRVRFKDGGHPVLTESDLV